jgi:3-phosphoshikimate 1-carboxyvinyltransferase
LAQIADQQLKPFYWRGSLGASKSLYNRALVARSFFPQLKIHGLSYSDDVKYLISALEQFHLGFSEFDCGAGGTTLRFLMAHLSRQPGDYVIRGDQRLMSRPHGGLMRLLARLSVQVLSEDEGAIRISSQGWQIPQQTIDFPESISSQFLSAILLNAWDMPHELNIRYYPDQQSSLSYLHMTIGFLRALGMSIQDQAGLLTIPAQQRLRVSEVSIEPDMSSAFALSACALSGGEISIHDFPQSSLQPDFQFIEILKSMGADIQLNSAERILHVRQTDSLLPVELNLRNHPDLFPVLAILLTRAQGVSTLSGLESLAFKESNRLQNSMDLIAQLGFQCRYQNKKLMIQGEPKKQPNQLEEFSPDHDHRMAMAAALACRQGAKINILDPEVVNKSCPEFWEILASD